MASTEARTRRVPRPDPSPNGADVPLRGVSTVRIRRDDLLRRIKANRDGHRAVFEQALEGYHKAVIEHLTEALKDAKAGKKYTPNVSLPEPRDHTPEYDRVISMLEMSLDTELELSYVEFGQFALDDWGWKGDFIGTASNYTASAR
jgi:hypothetical protein